MNTTNDPKYSFGFIRHNEGNYLVDKSEPVMLLRGKDVGALACIVAYIDMLESEKPNSVINSHIDSSLERLETFLSYQLLNPHLRSIGCSRENHEHSAKYIQLAASKLKEWK